MSELNDSVLIHIARVKKPNSFFKLGSLVLFFIFNVNLMIGSALVDQTAQQVIAIDYCHFLNHLAAADPDHLYNEAMCSDSDRACILRFGQSGKYFYEVVAGREKFPISYVNSRAKAWYCKWMQNGCLSGEQGIISIEQENCCEDYFLTSNRMDFAASTSLVVPMLTLGLDHLYISPETKYQLESTAIKILIVASLCFSGYKIIKGSNVARIEQGTLISSPIKSIARETIPPALGETMIKHLPTSAQEADISLSRFHQKEAQSTKNPNIKSFHTYCIAANQIARALEDTETKLDQAYQKLNRAHDTASAALYRYGAVYVVSKIGCLCLDAFVPGLSILAHAGTELFGPTHAVVSTVVDYGASTVQSSTMNKFIVRPTVVEGEHSVAPQNLVEWFVGPDLTVVKESINQINEIPKETLIQLEGDLLEKIEEYKNAMLAVDAAYVAAVKEKKTADNKKMKPLDWWELSVRSGKNLKNFFQKNSLQQESDIPVGGFRHIKGEEEKDYNVYYRLYAKPADDSTEEPALMIGAHLLDTIPDIGDNAGILIQEVHVPIGTRLQKLNFTVSPNTQNACNQYRLLDVIPEDCFKEGKALEHFK